MNLVQIFHKLLKVGAGAERGIINENAGLGKYFSKGLKSAYKHYCVGVVSS